MSRLLVYDLPTRIFHWLFASVFLSAFIITKTVDDESVVFSYHMLLGMTLSFIVILRILWGIFGTRHAKFYSFALNPRSLFHYLSGIISGSHRLWAGHNPASSWAAIIMMGLTLALGLTGYRMATGPESHDIKEIHETLATLFMIIALLHIAGIFLHSIRHKDYIGLSMIDGKKSNIDPSMAIEDSKKLIAFIATLVTLAWASNLIANFDSKNRVLSLFGTKLQLGEVEYDNTESEFDNDNNENREHDEH